MTDTGKDEVQKLQSLKLYRKKVPPAVIALGILGVLLAIAFLVVMIWSAMQPPELPEPPMIR